MTLKKLASKIAIAEGLTHEATIGDVREIISLISDEFFKDPQSMLILLCDNGRRRKVRRLGARKKK